MKTMKMNKETNTNRVGISIQESTGVATVGDGLASQEDKSPVTTIENLNIENENENENENANVNENENEVTEVTTTTEEEKPTEDDEEIEFILKEIEDDELDESAEKQDANDSIENLEPHQSVEMENPNSSIENNKQDSSQKMSAAEFIKSSGYVTKDALLRGKERDIENRKTQLLEFENCLKRIGKKKMDLAINAVKKCEFVNWEINIMFGALDKHLLEKSKRKEAEQVDTTKPISEKRKTTEEIDPEHIDPNKKARLDDELDESEEISGILLPPAVKLLDEVDKYSTFELRANIGDASHPNLYIEPMNKKKFLTEFTEFVAKEGPTYNRDVPIGLVCSYFINKTFMVHCRNVQTLEFIDRNVHKLNELWPKADFVMIRRTSERKKIQIFIPYLNYDKAEVLEIIEKQNRMRVEKWQVNNFIKTEDGVRLDVEVDGGTYLRLLQDQDDLFFLLKRATIKLPANDDKLENATLQTT